MTRFIAAIFPFILATTYTACEKDSTNPGTAVSPPPVIVISPPTNKYLALGDSYTIGQGVSAVESYPYQTMEWLTANGIDDVPEPTIIAVTGWTTQNLQAALNSQKPVGPFELVSLLIGVNDQYRGMDIKAYETNFRRLVQEAIWLTGNRRSHVFVLSIPDYSVTPFALQLDRDRIAKQIDAFNLVNKQVSHSMEVKYLDITGLTREAKNNPSLICADGLHPSGLEYKRWAEKLGPMMKEVLK